MDSVIDDLHLMAADGLASPFIAADALYSPVSGRQIMVSRTFPGLSAMVPSGYGPTPCVFVESLPDTQTLSGFIHLVERTGVDREPQECWLVQIEAVGGVAWQFMTADELFPVPSEYAVLLEWKPKALNEGIKMHDAMIAEMGDRAGTWSIGSELEKEAVSRFVLSTGTSSISHAFSAFGAVDNAIKRFGSTIAMSEGPCQSLKAYKIDWFCYADA